MWLRARDNPQLEITKVAEYTGVTQAMMDGSVTGSPRTARSPTQTSSTVPGWARCRCARKLTKEQMTAHETQMQFFNEIREDIGLARTGWTGPSTGEARSHRPRTTGTVARASQRRAAGGEHRTYDIRRRLIPFVGRPQRRATSAPADCC